MNFYGYENIILRKVNPSDFSVEALEKRTEYFCNDKEVLDKFTELCNCFNNMSNKEFNLFLEKTYENDVVVSDNNIAIDVDSLLIFDNDFLTHKCLSQLNIISA